MSLKQAGIFGAIGGTLIACSGMMFMESDAAGAKMLAGVGIVIALVGMLVFSLSRMKD